MLGRLNNCFQTNVNMNCEKMKNELKNIALVFAAGTGQRFGDSLPKQYHTLRGIPILITSMLNFQKHSMVNSIFLVVHEDYVQTAVDLLNKFNISKCDQVVVGGPTAMDSIYRGLCRIHDIYDDCVVLISDGTRPNVDGQLISSSIEKTLECGNAIGCKKCVETVGLLNDDNTICDIPDRRKTVSIVAPQTFRLKDIINYHDQIRAINPTYDGIVDCATICNVLGVGLNMVESNQTNIKITYPSDLALIGGEFDYANK